MSDATTPAPYVDAFKAVLAEVEAVHGAARVKFTEPALGRVGRVGAVWFLPDNTGARHNNGFHIDGRPEGGGLGPQVAAWARGRHVMLSVAQLTADDIRSAVRLVGLLP